MKTALRSILFCAALTVLAIPSNAQDKSAAKKKSKGSTAAQAPAPEKKVTIASKLKNTVAFDGLMQVYQDTTDGKLYLKLRTTNSIKSLFIGAMPRMAWPAWASTEEAFVPMRFL